MYQTGAQKKQSNLHNNKSKAFPAHNSGTLESPLTIPEIAPGDTCAVAERLGEQGISNKYQAVSKQEYQITDDRIADADQKKANEPLIPKEWASAL
jgi:hypothetical protein